MGGIMSNAFLDALRDEALRIEVGPAATSDPAVENLELSTPALSRAVRQSIITRRAERPIVSSLRMTGLSHNRLAMHEVTLPPVGLPEPEYCAA